MASKLFNYGAGIGSVFAGSKAAGKTGGYLPGMPTKSFPNIIETLNSSTTNDAIEFGSVVVRDVVNGLPIARGVKTTDTAVKMFGIALNDVKSATTIFDNIVYAYHLGDQISVLRRGQVCVPVQAGTPAIGGQVYVRIAASATNTGLVIGGIETTSVDNENVAVPGWHFESAGYYPTDASASGSSASAVTGLCATIKISPVAEDNGFDTLDAAIDALDVRVKALEDAE